MNRMIARLGLSAALSVAFIGCGEAPTTWPPTAPNRKKRCGGRNECRPKSVSRKSLNDFLGPSENTCTQSYAASSTTVNEI